MLIVSRIRILEDRSLKIERTRQSDEGIYVCRAENSVGFQEAEAKLTVHCEQIIYTQPMKNNTNSNYL